MKSNVITKLNIYIYATSVKYQNEKYYQWLKSPFSAILI